MEISDIHGNSVKHYGRALLAFYYGLCEKGNKASSGRCIYRLFSVSDSGKECWLENIIAMEFGSSSTKY